MSLVFAIFISLPYIQKDFLINIFHIQETQLSEAIIVGVALAISLPFLIAIYYKLKALTILLTQLGIKKEIPENLYPKSFLLF